MSDIQSNAGSAGGWEVDRERLFVTGHPPLLTGHFGLRNRTGERRKLRAVRISGLALRGGREVASTVSAPTAAVRVYARAEGGEETRVPLRLRVDPHMSPGIYEGEIECDGERRPLTVHVHERWRLRVAPRSHDLKVRAGERVVRAIEVANLGNVPWELPRAAFATLHEPEGAHQSLFAALKKVGAEGGQRVLDELARELADREIDPPVVRVRAEGRLLQPGESRLVELEFDPPASLRRHRRYSGSVRFENARLRFDLEIVEGATAPESIP